MLSSVEPTHLTLAAVAVIAGVALYWKSIWLVPLGPLVLLPFFPFDLAMITINGREFGFTVLDMCFLVFLLAFVLVGRGRLRELRKTSPQIWRATIFPAFVILMLLVLNTLANYLYQSTGHLIASDVLFLRTYCQALIVPLAVVLFIDRRALRGAVVLLYLLTAMGMLKTVLTPVSAGHGRSTPFDMNPNAYGQVMAVVLVFAFSSYLAGRPGWFRPHWSIGTTVLAGLGILVTGSRESIVRVWRLGFRT